MEWEDRELDLYGHGTSRFKPIVRRLLITKEEVTAATRNIAPYLSFAIYLILYTVVAVNSFPGKYVFEQQNAIRSAISDKLVMDKTSNALVSFKNISSLDGFWAWVNDALLDCAYPEQGTLPSVDACSRSFRVLGAIRLRQARVRADSCPVSSSLVPRTGDFLGAYTLSPRDVAAHGLFSTQLSLQAYVLDCDPARAPSPAPNVSRFGAAGDPRCGRAAAPPGQVGRVSGCYAGSGQVAVRLAACAPSACFARGGGGGGGGARLEDRGGEKDS